MEIMFKTFPPLCLFCCIFGQHLPERMLCCWEEEEGLRPDIMGIFRGGWRHQPPPKNGAHLQGQLMVPPTPENEPHFQGRLMPPPAPKDRIPWAGLML